MDEKTFSLSSEAAIPIEDVATPVHEVGTISDRDAMQRLGKQQLFKRNFGFTSIFGFAMILMCTWETVLGTVAFGLSNGGPSGLLYTYIAVWLGYILVAFSMAEMASMAPTAGGQYHWCSEFAPRGCQKQVSYVVGWLGILAWQVGSTVGAFISATMIQGLVVLNYPTYGYQRWHGTLIAMLITLFSALFNVLLAKWLPIVEHMTLVLHFAAWIAILVPLWVLAPRTPHSGVWNLFVDAGWGNTGVACLVGMITNIGALIGSDAPAHMAEELNDASKTLPRVMGWTILVNGAMGFIALVTFCYTVGDIEAAITTTTGYPIIEVFYSATDSVAGTIGLSVLLIILNFVNNITSMAGASRQTFAFARDRALPFSPWISRVSPRFVVPTNAIILSSVVACIFHCINIGSAIAWNIIMSVGTVALVSSYIASIGCIMWRRIRKFPLLPSPFSLGSYTGLLINCLALAFCLLTFLFAFFPPIPHPATVGMNWAIVVYTGVLSIAAVYYVFCARYHYKGPVEYVRKSM